MLFFKVIVLDILVHVKAILSPSPYKNHITSLTWETVPINKHFFTNYDYTINTLNTTHNKILSRRHNVDTSKVEDMNINYNYHSVINCKYNPKKKSE